MELNSGLLICSNGFLKVPNSVELKIRLSVSTLFFGEFAIIRFHPSGEWLKQKRLAGFQADT